ncbi:MAG: asparagine synthase [Bacteroidota bacterium]|jgi:asparagine synthase (glutamine-hydrolysing)
MCGIHGIIDQKKNIDDSASLMNQMLESTKHRGPDFSNFVQNQSCTLGHNRLSIIDLNPEANQPMNFGKYWIVFNGEIYNYKELRADLNQQGVQFTTSSDTEVILKSFDYFGNDCVKRFIGMWSFAIYNTETEELFCSRDRFGIKPFYYIHTNQSLYFSSEIKSLKITPYFSSELNLNQVARGLQLGWIGFENQTYFNCIQSLEPGHNLIFSNGELKVKRYWDYPENHIDTTNKNIVDEFRTLFQDSLNLHVRSDVPVGATLSGGLDSSSIVSTMLKNKLSNQLETFSIYYEEAGFDERPFIETIEKKYPGQFHLNLYSPNQKEIAEDFHAISNTMDFPLSGSSPISQYYVMKLVKSRGIKVVLSGQGADDYMGGYLHSFYRLHADYLRKFQFIKFLDSFHGYKGIQSASNSKMLDVFLKSSLSLVFNENKLYETEFHRFMPFLMKETVSWNSLNSKYHSKFLDFHYALMHYSSLPTLLHYEDRNSMAHSIESRVPFLDHRLVELMFQLPAEFKIKNGWTKYILRESMNDILPSEIQWRRDKKGFVTPGEISWLRGSLSHLLEIDYQLLDFLDKQKTKNLIEDFKKGNNKYSKLVWRVACLNYWLKNS